MGAMTKVQRLSVAIAFVCVALLVVDKFLLS